MRLAAVVGGAAAVIGAPFFLVREEVEHPSTARAATGRHPRARWIENGENANGSHANGARLNRLVVALAIFVRAAAATPRASPASPRRRSG